MSIFRPMSFTYRMGLPNDKLWHVPQNFDLGNTYVTNCLLCQAWYFILFYLTSHYKISANFLIYPLLHREDPEVSYGLKWAIAGKGVIVKDKVFLNLETSELQEGGATYPGMCKLLLSCNDVYVQLVYDTITLWLHLEHADCLSGIPLHVRGDVIGGVPGVSKAQFAKLLKLVGSKGTRNG